MVTRTDPTKKLDAKLEKNKLPGFVVFSDKGLLGGGHYFRVGAGSWEPENLGKTEPEARSSVLTLIERAKLDDKEHSVEKSAEHLRLAQSIGVKLKDKKNKPPLPVEEPEDSIDEELDEFDPKEKADEEA